MKTLVPVFLALFPFVAMLAGDTPPVDSGIRKLIVYEEVVRVKPPGQGPLPFIRDYYFHPDAGWAILSFEQAKGKFGPILENPRDERQMLTFLDRDGIWRGDWPLDSPVSDLVYYGPSGVIVSDDSWNYKIVLRRFVNGKEVNSFDAVAKTGRDTEVVLKARRFPGRAFCNSVILVPLSDSGWLLDTQLNLIASTDYRGFRDLRTAACGPSIVSFVYLDAKGARFLGYSLPDRKLTEREIYGLNSTSQYWSDSRIGPWPTDFGASILVPVGYPIKYWKVRTATMTGNPLVEMMVLKPGEPIPAFAIPIPVDGELDSANLSKTSFTAGLPGDSLEALRDEEYKRLADKSDTIRYQREILGQAVRKNPRAFWPDGKVCRALTTSDGILCMDIRSKQLSQPIVPESALWSALGSRWATLTQLSDDWVHFRAPLLFSLRDFKFFGRSNDAGSYADSLEGFECDIWTVPALGENNSAFVPCRKSVPHIPERPPPWEFWVNLATGEQIPALESSASSQVLPVVRNGKLMRVVPSSESHAKESLRLLDLKTGEETRVDIPPEWQDQTPLVRRIQPTDTGWIVLYALSDTGLWAWALDPAAKPLGPPRLLDADSRSDLTSRSLFSGKYHGKYVVATLDGDYRFYLLREDGLVEGAGVLTDHPPANADPKKPRFPQVAITSEDGVYLFYPDRIERLRFE